VESKSLIVGLIIGGLLGAGSISLYTYSQIQKLEKSYDILNENYVLLLETFKLYELTDSYIEIPFNITVPNVNEHEFRQLLFSVGYGALIQVYIGVYTLENTYRVNAGVNWIRGNDANNLGGYGIHFTELPKYITGVAYCKVQFETEESICFTAGVKMNPPAKDLERQVKMTKEPP